MQKSPLRKFEFRAVVDVILQITIQDRLHLFLIIPIFVNLSLADILKKILSNWYALITLIFMKKN